MHSIPAQALEREVGRLIDRLLLDGPTWRAVLHVRAQAQAAADPTAPGKAVENALADCQARFERAKQLYLALELDEAEYKSCLARHRAAVAQLRRAVTADVAQLGYCRAKLVTLQEAWRSGSVSEQRASIRAVFDDIVVDLDTGHITAFRLKPWADDYLQTCAAALDGPMDSSQRMSIPTDPVSIVLAQLYPTSAPRPPPPAKLAQQARNARVRERYAQGETLAELARAYGVSTKRVHQLVHGRRR